jgi:hypothetical protein
MTNPNQPPNSNQAPQPGGPLVDAEAVRPPMPERVRTPDRLERLGERVVVMSEREQIQPSRTQEDMDRLNAAFPGQRRMERTEPERERGRF